MAQSSSCNRLTTNDALDYLRTVKARFGDRKDVYDQFLQIMKEFKSSMVNTDGVIQRVKALFVGHRDLILGFNTFLPRGYEIRHDFDEEERPQIEFDQAISYVNKIKARFQNQEPVYKTFLEILNAYRKGQKSIKLVYEEVSNLFHGERDLLQEFRTFLPDAMSAGPGIHNQDTFLPSQVGMMHRGQPYQGGHLLGAQYHRARTGHAHGYSQEDTRRNQRKISRRDQEEQFARKTYFSQELGWLDKMKKKVPTMEAFYDFLRITTLWHLDILTLQEFNQITEDFFKKLGPIGTELQDDFQQFLFKIVNMEIDVETTGNFASLPSQQAPGDVVINNNSTYKRMVPSKDKYLTRPFSDLDHSNCERITVSYVKLPDDYPQLKCSGQDDLCREVLNQTWVNVVSGSEDFSFRNFRKNQYEEALFRAEDDHHEIDVAIEQIKSTKNSLERIFERLQLLPVEQRDNQRLALNELEEYQWAVLDKVYDVRGRELVAMLRENPWGALPKVLKRVEQKFVELCEVRAKDMMGKWRTIFQQNFSRSLDHRSFYFKQTDKKTTSNRTLAIEIKDRAETRLNNPDYLKILCAAGYWSEKVAQTDLRLEFDHPEVFEDMYQILRWGLECYCKGEVGNQILQFWIKQWEGLLQLPARSFAPLSTDEIEDDEDEEDDVLEEEGNNTTNTSVTEQPPGTVPTIQAIAQLPREIQNEESASQVAGNDQNSENEIIVKNESQVEVEADVEVDNMVQQRNGNTVTRAGLMDVTEEEEVVCENESAEEEEAINRAVASTDADIDMDAKVTPRTPEDTEDALMDEDVEGEPSVTEEIINEPDEETMAGSIPVYVQPGVAKDSQSNIPAAKQEESSPALYTTDNFYVMARLCDFLFQRLKHARYLCKKDPTNGGNTNGGDSSTSGVNGNGDTLFQEKHSSLMTMLHEFVKGNMEGSAFEDKCRQLLGQNSYLLFTLDKLVQRLCKQLQSIVHDDCTIRCQALKEHESERKEDFDDETYFLNVQTVVPESDSLFRFQSFDAYTVDITLMDYLKTSVITAVADSRNYVDAKLLISDQPDLTWDEILEKYSSRFLRRSARTKRPLESTNEEEPQPLPQPQPQPSFNHAEYEQIMKNNYVQNGLQIKINPQNFKRAYVYGTEDISFFVGNKRPRRSVEDKWCEIKRKKLDTVVQQRLASTPVQTVQQFTPQQHQELDSFKQLQSDIQMVNPQLTQPHSLLHPHLTHNQQVQQQLRQQQQQYLLQQQQQQQQLMKQLGRQSFGGQGL